VARSTRALLAMVIVVVFATAAAAGCGSDDGYPQNGVYEMPNYQSGNLSYRAGYDYLAYHQTGDDPVASSFDELDGSDEYDFSQWRQGCVAAAGDYDIDY
jgi:hypothetical protein